MDEPPKYYTEQKKPDVKGHMFCGSIRRLCPDLTNPHGDWKQPEGESMGGDYQQEEATFGGDKKCSGMIGGCGCITLSIC